MNTKVVKTSSAGTWLAVLLGLSALLLAGSLLFQISDARSGPVPVSNAGPAPNPAHGPDPEIEAARSVLDGGDEDTPLQESPTAAAHAQNNDPLHAVATARREVRSLVRDLLAGIAKLNGSTAATQPSAIRQALDRVELTGLRLERETQELAAGNSKTGESLKKAYDDFSQAVGAMPADDPGTSKRPKKGKPGNASPPIEVEKLAHKLQDTVNKLNPTIDKAVAAAPHYGDPRLLSMAQMALQNARDVTTARATVHSAVQDLLAEISMLSSVPAVEELTATRMALDGAELAGLRLEHEMQELAAGNSKAGEDLKKAYGDFGQASADGHRELTLLTLAQPGNAGYAEAFDRKLQAVSALKATIDGAVAAAPDLPAAKDAARYILSHPAVPAAAAAPSPHALAAAGGQPLAGAPPLPRWLGPALELGAFLLMGGAFSLALSTRSEVARLNTRLIQQGKRLRDLSSQVTQSRGPGAAPPPTAPPQTPPPAQKSKPEPLPKSGWRPPLGSSVMGTSHVAKHVPCQDAHLARRLDNGSLIIAVADGAGSAKRAEEGSQTAVKAAFDHLSRQLTQQPPRDAAGFKTMLKGALEAVRNDLRRQAGNGRVDDLATTLLLAVATDKWVGILQVGDGAIVCGHRNGSHQLLSQVDDDPTKFINETTFVTSKDYAKVLYVEVWPLGDITGLAVCTDGVAFLAIEQKSNQPSQSFYTDLFAFARTREATHDDLAGFLSSDRVNERTDDDKTLVVSVLL